MTSKSEMAKPKSGVSRRTVVKGTAWAVPAVVVAPAAPAMAASPCLTATFGGNSCKQPGNPNGYGYRLEICLTNSCSSPVTVTITRIKGKAGSSTDQAVGTTVTVPANGQTCLAPISYCNNNSGNFIDVYYKIGTAAEAFFELPSPVQDCSGVPLICT